MKNRSSNGAQGLSLIELLIASVIAASAAAVLLGGLMSANRGAQLRIEQTLSTQALASELARLGEALDPNAPTSGACTFLQEACRWNVAWIATPLDPLAAATLTVTLHGQPQHLVTYRPVAQPPPPQ